MEEYRKYEPIFGSWYLNKLIGKGSFGKVFEITREEVGTTYRAALKVITIPQDDDDIKSRLTEGTDMDTISEYYAGILREIINENEIMAQLKGNSNIVSYEDHQIIPHDDGIGYDILIRMELLTPLLDRLIERKLSEEEVVRLGIDMCKALELCHKKNIIHRDIKPQNIFISDNGDFKLGDFGIARTIEKTTGGMSKKGTYKYMAPEVFRGDHYNETVDLYSLGIVMYSLLNGNRGPFLPAPPARVTHNDEEEARLRRFRGEPIPAPKDGGEMLSYIIQKACAFDPAARYMSAEQMRSDLESYYYNYLNPSAQGGRGFTGRFTVPPGLGPEPNPTPQPAPQPTPQPGPRPGPQPGPGPDKKRFLVIGLIAAAVIFLAAGIGLLKGGDSDGGQEAGPAVVEVADDTVTVLSSDWDWDSSRDEGGPVVDAILLVRNDTDHAITGIEFKVNSEDGALIENAGEQGAPMTVRGYVASGSAGIMTGEIHTFEHGIKPDNSTYSVSGAFQNDAVGGYTVPSGHIVKRHGNDNNYYDVSIDNQNDVPVSASSRIVMVRVRDNEIIESDATGRLTDSVSPHTMGFVQEDAFYDPHIYTKDDEINEFTIYAIDVDYYENAQ